MYRSSCDDLRDQKTGISSAGTAPAYISKQQPDVELEFAKASRAPSAAAASEAEPQAHKQMRHRKRSQGLLEDAAKVRIMTEQSSLPQSRSELLKRLIVQEIIVGINQFSQV